MASHSRKRCRVNTVCRHELAVYWYYVVDSCVLFVNLEARKPDRYAAPCCARCASEIMRRALQHEEKEPGLIDDSNRAGTELAGRSPCSQSADVLEDNGIIAGSEDLLGSERAGAIPGANADGRVADLPGA